MAMKNTKKVSIVSELMKKQDSEKRYSVIIERDALARDGYDFFSPEDVNQEKHTNSCVVVFYFKDIKGKHNSDVIIESISGDDFSERRRIISDFVTNHALRYAVQMDGFYKNI